MMLATVTIYKLHCFADFTVVDVQADLSGRVQKVPSVIAFTPTFRYAPFKQGTNGHQYWSQSLVYYS